MQKNAALPEVVASIHEQHSSLKPEACYAGMQPVPAHQGTRQSSARIQDTKHLSPDSTRSCPYSQPWLFPSGSEARCLAHMCMQHVVEERHA